MKVVALCPELTPTIVARSGWWGARAPLLLRAGLRYLRPATESVGWVVPYLVCLSVARCAPVWGPRNHAARAQNDRMRGKSYKELAENFLGGK